MHSAGLLDHTPASEGGIKPNVKVRLATDKDDRDNMQLRK